MSLRVGVAALEFIVKVVQFFGSYHHCSEEI